MNDLPDTVLDAANKLISALGLHEDTRDTVQSVLADMWDAGHDAALSSGSGSDTDGYEPVLTKGPADPARPWLLSHRRTGFLHAEPGTDTLTAFATRDDAKAYADQLTPGSVTR